MVLDTRRQVPMAFADTYTRSRIAASLIDCLWRQGRFKLGDIALSLSWKWNGEPLGNMAAFYSSARAAADYLDSLGVTLSGYDFAPSRDSSSVPFFRSQHEDGSFRRKPAGAGPSELDSVHPV